MPTPKLFQPIEFRSVTARNRIAVALDWFWSYLTFQRGSRLITGGGAED